GRREEDEEAPEAPGLLHGVDGSGVRERPLGAGDGGDGGRPRSAGDEGEGIAAHRVAGRGGRGARGPDPDAVRAEPGTDAAGDAEGDGPSGLGVAPRGSRRRGLSRRRAVVFQRRGSASRGRPGDFGRDPPSGGVPAPPPAGLRPPRGLTFYSRAIITAIASPVFGWRAWKTRNPVLHSGHFTISRWKFSLSLIVARQKQRMRSPTISCAPTSDFAIWRKRSLVAS